MSVMAETSQWAMGQYVSIAAVGLVLYAWTAVSREALLVKVHCGGGLGLGGGGDGDGDVDGGGERKMKNTTRGGDCSQRKFANRGCRAHEHGRCVYAASECSAVHFADSDTIDCNSSITEGDVRYTNTRFGICRNFLNPDRPCLPLREVRARARTRCRG